MVCGKSGEDDDPDLKDDAKRSNRLQLSPAHLVLDIERKVGCGDEIGPMADSVSKNNREVVRLLVAALWPNKLSEDAFSDARR